MNKIKILGDGQIWDVKGVNPDQPDKIFEDLFSGRALGELASREKIFYQFLEKGENKVTGISVTKALLSNNLKARRQAKDLLEKFARNASKGIKLLTKGKVTKESWHRNQRNHWRGINGVIIGGGVSEGKTGKIIVDAIKEDLNKNGLNNISIYKADFPGKDAGFLGSVAFIADKVLIEAKKLKIKRIACLGIDIGRDEIGIGAIILNAKTNKIIKVRRNLWFFSSVVDTPHKDKLYIFKDSGRLYNKNEKLLGFKIRESIINILADLILKAENKARVANLNCSRFIGVGLPGQAQSDGYLIGSVHYLPFFRKQDNFHFSSALEKRLKKLGSSKFKICIVNDGIAAGLANLRFGIGLERLKLGKYAFLGPGSGLGGFAGRVY